PAERGKPSASPLKVCLCLTPVKHLTPPLEWLTSCSCAGQAQCQSAEGVPLPDTCQSIHAPSGGANELQLSGASPVPVRSEEHTAELHSHLNVVCRLLLGKHTHPHTLHLYLRAHPTGHKCSPHIVAH